MSQFIEMFDINEDNHTRSSLVPFANCVSDMTKGPFGSDIKKSLYVPKSESAYKVYIQINAIEKNESLGDYYISKEYFDSKMHKFEVRPGDYIITCDGTLGKYIQIPDNAEKGIISASLLRLTLKDMMLPRYFEFLWDVYMLPTLLKEVRNTALKHLPSATKIGEMPIPLPNLLLQKRFSDIARQADKSGFVSLKSQFIEMFGNQDINDRCWKESIVKNEFKLTMGKTPARNNPNYWQSGSNKWVSISDMAKYGRYTGDTQEKITDKAISESGIKVVPKGTIIMSFKLSIGRTALTSEDIYTNEAIMAFRDVDESKFNLTFLQFLIANKNWLLNAKQAVKGQTLNKDSIGNSKIITPPLELQKQFADIYNQADKSGYGYGFKLAS